jgi:hypothetical protein
MSAPTVPMSQPMTYFLIKPTDHPKNYILYRFCVAQWSSEDSTKADFVMIERSVMKEDGYCYYHAQTGDIEWIGSLRIRFNEILSSEFVRKVYTALVSQGFEPVSHPLAAAQLRVGPLAVKS